MGGRGGGWGLGTGRNVFERCSQHGEGDTPTIAAKLFQPQPKRNTEKEESQGHGGGQSDRNASGLSVS